MTPPTFPTIAFPYDLDRLEFTGDTAGGSLDVTLSLSRTEGETTTTDEILSTTLTFDSAKTVTLTDLAELLNTRLEDAPATLTLAYDDGTTSGELTTTLLPCRVPLAQSAVDWVKRCALTLTTGTKTCALGARQIFALYGTGYTVRLRSSRGVITVNGDETDDPGGPIENVSTANGITIVTLNWQGLDLYNDDPDAYAKGFTAVVECIHYGDDGKTDQPVITLTFRVIPAPYGSDTILFRNAFGQWETMLFAAVTKKDKPTRTGGTFEGRYRNYLVENATTYEGVSFSLSDDELQTAGDFLEATTLCRLSDSTIDLDGGADITSDNYLALTDGELEASSTPDALPRLKATWREEKRRPVRGRTPVDIFDNTFDDTYN